MRERILTTYMCVCIIFCFFSCESIEETPQINAEEYYGDGSFFISLARLSFPEVRERNCGRTHEFELRFKQNLEEYATAVVYTDGQFLNIQYDLLHDRINEGWGMDRSLVWIGKKEDWKEGKNGPPGGWGEVDGIIINWFSNYPSIGLHQIPLEEWMLDECYTIAIRLTIRDHERNWGGSADGFINNGDYLTYSFNEQFCLEKCDDPGTLNVSFWENNPEIWYKGVTVGNIFYSEELAIQIMKGITTNDDLSNVLFEELVSAKLNVDLGNTSYCIIEAIEEADTWMEENGPVGSGVLSDHPAWATGNSLANQLESYNNGLMCAEPAN